MSARRKKAEDLPEDLHSAPKGASDDDPVAATVRIDRAIYKKLAEAVERDGTKFKTAWEEAISNWLASRVGAVDRITVVRELQASIASAVQQRLMEDESWISDLVVARERRSFDAGIMGARSLHYADEKDTLAKCLVEPELLGHIAEALARDKSRNACLIIDSGSGPVPFFERLSAALETEAWRDLAGRVTVLTNNIAGAGTYMRRARDTGQSGLQHGVAGPFKCSLLPGDVNSDYAAVVGANTVAALNRLKEENARGGILFIGLLAANWVQVRRAENGNPYAIPLVTDDDQVEIKRALCSLCDRLYLPVPSPKLFLGRTIDEINEGLRAGGRTYQPIFDVGTKNGQDLARKIKLVTTLRPDTKDILYGHSEVLKAMYPSSKIVDAQKGEMNTPGDSDADAYFFNDTTQSGKTPAAQKAVAFPHEHTRTPEFMKRFFMIS